MRFYRLIGTVACLLVLSGCLSLTAVNDFAKQSSLITANKAMMDDTEAQSLARRYNGNVLDPSSKEFTDRLAVTYACLDVLNAYMTVLAQLSGGSVGNVSSEFSKIGDGLTALKVTDPKVQTALTAASALTNLLLQNVVRSDIRRLIVSSASQVDKITEYLVAQAQTTSNTYNLAIAFNNRYWNDMYNRSTPDSVTRELANRARKADIATLNAKAAAADAAIVAFQKIRADNAALVANADRLDAKSLVEQLKADEPYLMAAINALKSL